MTYIELPPPADLASVVHCTWRFEDARPGPLDRVVPDGRCELIVHGGAAFSERDAAGRWREQPRVLFAGQLTKPLHLRGNGRADVIGVRFRYAASRDFFGAPLREATDRRVDLEREWRTATHDVESILDSVRERIRAHAPARDESVERCVDRIANAEGALPVAELADFAGIGRRQLERRFADAVGIGPALLASIIRFRRVFDEIDHGGARPWTDAAAAVGYSDQSHFIREFRRFVGCTPGEFVRSSGGLAAALVEG